MQLFKLATTMGCLALAGAILAPVASADEWNKKTVMTFSGPVEIPGVHLTGWGVLPAGTYVFKILDSQSDRHIVQIFNKDETVIYATILAIPNYRLRATDKTVITFSERPAGEPEALRAWFYPGRNWGEEFVYPKEKAIALAKSSNVPVLYTSAEIPAEVAEPIQSAAAPIVLDMKRAPIMAIKPTGEDAVLAEVVTIPPAATAVQEPAAVEVASAPQPSSQPAASPQPAQSLPATASSMPLIGLLGLMSFAAAFALRAFSTRLSKQRL
jgi:hypothetical protein